MPPPEATLNVRFRRAGDFDDVLAKVTQSAAVTVVPDTRVTVLHDPAFDGNGSQPTRTHPLVSPPSRVIPQSLASPQTLRRAAAGRPC